MPILAGAPAMIAAAGLGHLDEELVVADERNEFALAVQRIFAEHLGSAERTCLCGLIENVLDRFRTRCHQTINPFIGAIFPLSGKTFAPRTASDRPR